MIAYVPEGAVNPPTAHMRFPGTIATPATRTAVAGMSVGDWYTSVFCRR